MLVLVSHNFVSKSWGTHLSTDFTMKTYNNINNNIIYNYFLYNSYYGYIQLKIFPSFSPFRCIDHGSFKAHTMIHIESFNVMIIKLVCVKNKTKIFTIKYIIKWTWSIIKISIPLVFMSTEYSILNLCGYVWCLQIDYINYSNFGFHFKFMFICYWTGYFYIYEPHIYLKSTYTFHN